MRALVWKENGRIEPEAEWPEPELPGEDGVIVRVMAAGVCATDLHMAAGKLDFARPPWVLGHEMAGIVERVGPAVQDWRPGDRVIVDPVVSCGSCRHCQSGRKHRCPRGGELGTTYGSGGYGEKVAAKAANLYRLPDGMSFAEGAMMEPLNCTLGAIERVRDIAGSDCVVFGPGPAGLLFVQLAKAYGAASVTLVGLDDERLALGRRLGADHLVHLGRVSLEEALGEGGAYGVAIEAAGSPAAVAGCFRHAASGGTVVLYGLHGEGQATIDSDDIVHGGLTVCTCTSAPLLWEKGIRLAQSGRINVGSIVSDLVPEAEAAGLVNDMLDGLRRPVKAVIIRD